MDHPNLIKAERHSCPELFSDTCKGYATVGIRMAVSVKKSLLVFMPLKGILKPRDAPEVLAATCQERYCRTRKLQKRPTRGLEC